MPFEPARVLELGFGTAETTQRLLDRFPATSASPASTRALRWSSKQGSSAGRTCRLGRIEDPLPDGPWDLVIAVLTVAELDSDGVRELFRRVRDHSRALVIADVLEPEQAADCAAEWAGGEVVWEEDGLAVVRAVYD